MCTDQNAELFWHCDTIYVLGVKIPISRNQFGVELGPTGRAGVTYSRAGLQRLFLQKTFFHNTCLIADVVNAGAGLKTLDKKLEWNKLFEEHLKNLDAKKPVILTGDLNVAHEEIGGLLEQTCCQLLTTQVKTVTP